jgi:2-polyprenyl-3-methyl-5-hydroxy-6-metoxy-1,4-benzoquinol methylase
MAAGGEEGGIEGRVEAFFADSSWTLDLMEHSGLELEAFSDLFACTCRHRDRVCAPIPLPAWATGLEGEAFEARRAEVSRARGWAPAPDAAALLHRETSARYAHKGRLYREWLESLERVREPGRELRILDYGCGAAPFSQLALSLPEARCTLADVDERLLDYLAFRCARRWGERAAVHRLRGAPGRCSAATRVPVQDAGLRGRFGAILLTDVLEHTLDPLGCLLRLFRHLEPRGLLFVHFPHTIQGDWHTPEAWYLHRWCFALLRGTCRRLGPRAWQRRAGPAADLALRIAGLLHATLSRRARRFAHRTFEERGEELARAVRSKGREISAQELLASVDGT